MQRPILALAFALVLPMQVLAQTPPSIVAPATKGKSVVRQIVHDKSDAEIGQIQDVLVSKGGRVHAVILSVGSSLGLGTKMIAVPINLIVRSMRNGKPYLTLDSTKEAMQDAPGLKFDQSQMQWVPETAPSR